MTKSAEWHDRFRGGSARRLWVLFALLVLVWPLAAHSQNGPVAPCGLDEQAPYPPFTDPPSARNWRAGDLPPGWVPASCIAWAAQRFTVLTALAAHFRFAGSADDLLARFGAQSAWRGVRYWSVTDGRWDTLIADAAALESADRRRRRADFTLPELKSGADLYFLQQDNRSSDAVVYRMRVGAIDSGRLVVTIENVSAVSLLIFTLFDSGDLESTYVFKKLGPEDWGYFSLSGAREGAAVIGNYEASYLNRAAAIYRHLVGIPGDQEPPMAP